MRLGCNAGGICVTAERVALLGHRDEVAVRPEDHRTDVLQRGSKWEATWDLFWTLDSWWPLNLQVE